MPIMSRQSSGIFLQNSLAGQWEDVIFDVRIPHAGMSSTCTITIWEGPWAGGQGSAGQQQSTMASHQTTESHDMQIRATCRDIKHLYHYYLHGPLGRRPGQSGPAAVNDGISPDIIVQCLKNNRCAWRHSLVDVCDDMESKYLEVDSYPPAREMAEVVLTCKCNRGRSAPPQQGLHQFLRCAVTAKAQQQVLPSHAPRDCSSFKHFYKPLLKLWLGMWQTNNLSSQRLGR